mgnify:FL=1
MRKTCLLGVLLFLFAALDMIVIEQIFVWEEQLAGQIATRQPDEGQIPSQASNRGVPDNIADAIRADLQIFPIPESTLHPKYTVSYEDSWMTARSFGGERGHEGTDLMLSPDRRGIFPVLSMTDGVVEKQGWLPQGGYRLGIRSDRGIYYYYAHLYDYAEGIEEGTIVVSGQLLGFAGDTGYSNIEGTVGNFPVHLHVGIYYNDTKGQETAVNPYPFLQGLETVAMPY